MVSQWKGVYVCACVRKTLVLLPNMVNEQEGKGDTHTHTHFLSLSLKTEDSSSLSALTHGFLNDTSPPLTLLPLPSSGR